jgi:hypothetical protein
MGTGRLVPTTGVELVMQIIGGIFGGGTLLKVLDWSSARLAERAKERREEVNDTVTRLRQEITDMEADRDRCRKDAERERAEKDAANRWAAQMEAMLWRGGMQPPPRPQA